MSDSAFKTAAFPGHTTAELRAALNDGGRDRISRNKIESEIARREAVAQGDESRMTPGERLRYIKAQGGR